jgi:hypothetical protein
MSSCKDGIPKTNWKVATISDFIMEIERYHYGFCFQTTQGEEGK